MPIVPDASVAAAWMLPDERTSYSNQILAQVEKAGAVVPALWQFELANIVVMALRRNRITQQEAWEGIARIQALPITVDDHDDLALLSSLSSLAIQDNLTAYDASYLEIAVRRSLPLATFDAQLRMAAQQHGVVLL